MTGPIRPVSGQPPAIGDAAREAKLRKAAHDLEGVFVNEMFKAMRATVPDDGLLAQNSGQDMFTGMLDQHLAETYAEHAGKGMGEALYHQLSRRLPDSAPVKGTP
jgi:flagellar protein FlgJ